jgi:hypothetical protein
LREYVYSFCGGHLSISEGEIEVPQIKIDAFTQHPSNRRECQEQQSDWTKKAEDKHARNRVFPAFSVRNAL